jgi:hypothetical protein
MEFRIPSSERKRIETSRAEQACRAIVDQICQGAQQGNAATRKQGLKRLTGTRTL